MPIPKTGTFDGDYFGNEATVGKGVSSWSAQSTCVNVYIKEYMTPDVSRTVHIHSIIF
jgi:hypothetical protein